MVKRQLALGAAGGKLSGPAAWTAALSERKLKHPVQCSGQRPIASWVPRRASAPHVSSTLVVMSLPATPTPIMLR